MPLKLPDTINNPYSEHTAQVIDEEVQKMIAEQQSNGKKRNDR